MTNNSEKNEDLIPLTPNTKANNIQNYKKYLDTALENKNIKNIALSGNYGSGKSSILATYFNNQKYHDKILQISLANFKITDETNQDDMKNIEKNIINQILYQISANEIPLTNFKIKRELTNPQKAFFCLEALLIISIIFPFNFIENQTFINFQYVLLSFCILTNLFYFLKYLPLKKMNLKFQNIETEIHNQNDELFEKYADEIIYLLEKSNKEILIIEDLDRFNQINIFEKLRELNIKVNNKLSEKRFVFIYAIRDDLFSQYKERTKFFDLIIPVLPYLNSTNSYEKMKNELFSEYNIEDQLLYLLSFYIDDMRLLFNIHNEFVVYKNEINVSKNDDEKILSLIVLKNLFNTDFEKLKFRDGKIYKVFASIEKFKDGVREKINSAKEELTLLEEEKSQQIAKTEEDFFILWYIEHSYSGYTIEQLKSFMITDNHSFTYQENNQRYTITYTELKASEPYRKNLELALSKHNNSIFEKKIKKDISDLENKLSGNLKDFLLEDDVEEDMKILYRLIKFGYVDETYENYINYNYSEKNDVDFIKNVFNDSHSLSYDLELKDFVKISNSFTKEDYHKEAILNYNLLDYFIKNDARKSKFILQTSKNKDTNFIEYYYNYRLYQSINNIDILIEYLKELNIKLDLTKLDKIDERLVLQNLHLNDEKNFATILQTIWKNYVKDEKKINSVLSNSEINPSLKLYFIKNIKLHLNLNSFDNVYYQDLMTHNKIIPSSQNIQVYFDYSHKKIDSILSNFINNNEFYFDTKLSNDFFNELVNQSNINDISYKKLLETYDSKKYTAEFLNDDLQSEKLEILVRLNLLEFSKKMVELLEKHNIDYISSNEEEIANILLDNDDLNIQNLKFILDSQNVILENKKKLFLSRIQKLSIDEVKHYLEKLLFSDALLKIANQEGMYFNRKIDQNKENITILEYLKNKNILTDAQFNSILRMDK